MNKLQTELYEFAKNDSDFKHLFNTIYIGYFKKQPLKGFFELTLIDFIESIELQGYSIKHKYIDIAWLQLSNDSIMNLDSVYHDYKMELNDKLWNIKSNLTDHTITAN